MKARTDSDFVDLLDQEFAWRRKELTAIWGDVKSASEKSRPVRLRAAVAMLYAHWEGFVKAASEAYVEFVARRRLKHSELNDGFLTLALRSKLHEMGSRDDLYAHIEFVNFLYNELESRAKIPQLGMIKTGSNLTARRLKAIVLTLGLDYSPFELKENLMDAQLLDWRNKIAHGKYLCPEEADFTSLYNEVSFLLRNFKDQLVNAVLLRGYRRAE
jgi:hypothetical protein